MFEVHLLENLIEYIYVIACRVPSVVKKLIRRQVPVADYDQRLVVVVSIRQLCIAHHACQKDDK